MYVDVLIGKRGEIVIPAFIRRILKLKPGESVSLTVSENRIEVIPKHPNVVEQLRILAQKSGLRADQIVHGDRLYEEAF